MLARKLVVVVAVIGLAGCQLGVPGTVVHVRDLATVTAVRDAMVDRIWPVGGYPTAGADQVELDVPNPLAEPASALYRVDRMTIDMPDGDGVMTVRPWVYRPRPGVANGVLVVHSHGHGTNPEAGDHGKLIRSMVDAGYTVVGILMIGRGSTAVHDSYPDPTAGENHLRLFLEPIVRSINELGGDFSAVYATGKSGGGWATTLIAALDQRVKRSVQIAGTLPLYMKDPTRDWEQLLPGIRNVNGSHLLDYPDLYAMATDGGRRQLQILNTGDTCCFNAVGYESGPAYAEDVSHVAASFGGRWSLFWDARVGHVISEVAIARTLEFLGAP